MIAETIASFENGLLKPDAALPFPNHARVKLTIEPVWDPGKAHDAWRRLKKLIAEKPIRCGARFSRDQLHERD